MSLQGEAARALEAFKSGADVTKAAYGESGTPGGNGQSSATEVELVDTSDPSSYADENLVQEDPETAASPSTDEKATKQSKVSNSSGPKERVPVDKGKAHIEVDYEDRQKIRDAYLKAHGFRKADTERHKLSQRVKQLEPLEKEHTELKTTWSRLEQAFREKGEEGVVDLLRGQPGAYKAHLQKQIERQKFLEAASPEEVRVLQAQELAAEKESEASRLRKEFEDLKKSVQTEKDTAEEAALQSRVYPVFDKYKFAGKLGDADDEHTFDEMLWNTAIRRLAPYEEQGLHISQELVEKEFRGVAQAIRKRITAQADKAVGKAVEKKKQEATENVQAKVMSGYRNDSLSQEANQLMNTGRLGDLLKGWGKYGKLYNK